MKGPGKLPPTLFTTTSTRPSSARAASTRRCMPARSARLPGHRDDAAAEAADVRRPRASSWSALRAPITTSAPTSRQRPRDGGADAAAGAGHDRDAALQVEEIEDHRRLPVSREPSPCGRRRAVPRLHPVASALQRRARSAPRAVRRAQGRGTGIAKACRRYSHRPRRPPMRLRVKLDTALFGAATLAKLALERVETGIAFNPLRRGAARRPPSLLPAPAREGSLPPQPSRRRLGADALRRRPRGARRPDLLRRRAPPAALAAPPGAHGARRPARSLRDGARLDAAPRPAGPHAPAQPREQGLHAPRRGADAAGRREVRRRAARAPRGTARDGADRRLRRAAPGERDRRDAGRARRRSRALPPLVGRGGAHPRRRHPRRPAPRRSPRWTSSASTSRRSPRSAAASPARTCISALVQAEEAGDRLSRNELFTTCVLLLVAGNETTTKLIGNSVLALLRSPDQLELLRREPERMPAAVEELLRYDGPVQLTSRMVTEDRELRGHRLRRGPAARAGAGRRPTATPSSSRSPTAST